jgi:hypothetical protein
MAKVRGDTTTFDLLAWQPKEPEKRFDEDQIKAHSLSAKVARAISVSLEECQYERAEVAARMGQYLGGEVSLNMLNGYASQAREDHNISAVRFMALVYATQDWRLLQVLSDPFPVSIVDNRYIDVIRMAQIREKREAMEKEEKALKLKARNEGLL